MSGLNWIRKVGAALGLSAALLTGCSQPHRGDVMLAVATNFLATAEALEVEFEAETGLELVISSGSTGQLYAQIDNGAPYDIFLAADRERPRRLVESGRAMSGTQFTYAVGQLVLWMPDGDAASFDGEVVLGRADFRALAMANPDLAPYGAAARQVLTGLGLEEALAGKLVYGQNVGQAFALVASGNAELGFVAASQLAQGERAETGAIWRVPGELHEPIRQDLVLMRHAAANQGALQFINFLRSEKSQAIIRSYGYADIGPDA